jgi:hypothetical protein
MGDTMPKSDMTIRQRLIRRRPKLMRKLGEDKTPKVQVSVADDLEAPAVVQVRIELSDGRVEEFELPFG